MLSSLYFLLGEWRALNEPGEPSGRFRFDTRLNERVIIRSNFADYEAEGGRPAFRHEDLMIIHGDEPDDIYAEYYDNEGHVIRYEGEVFEEEYVVFTSLALAAAPRFRLSYKLAPDGKLYGSFDTALPEEPEQFTPYLQWSAVKVEAQNP